MTVITDACTFTLVRVLVVGESARAGDVWRWWGGAWTRQTDARIAALGVHARLMLETHEATVRALVNICNTGNVTHV